MPIHLVFIHPFCIALTFFRQRKKFNGRCRLGGFVTLAAQALPSVLFFFGASFAGHGA